MYMYDVYGLCIWSRTEDNTVIVVIAMTRINYKVPSMYKSDKRWNISEVAITHTLRYTCVVTHTHTHGHAGKQSSTRITPPRTPGTHHARAHTIRSDTHTHTHTLAHWHTCKSQQQISSMYTAKLSKYQLCLSYSRGEGTGVAALGIQNTEIMNLSWYTLKDLTKRYSYRGTIMMFVFQIRIM